MPYAEKLRGRADERHWSIRDLANRVDHSYEHIRKILTGDPVVSRALNKALCEALELPESQMWAEARREKALARYGADGLAGVLDAQGRDFFALWSRLERRDRAILRRIAEGLIAARRSGARKAKKNTLAANAPLS